MLAAKPEGVCSKAGLRKTQVPTILTAWNNTLSLLFLTTRVASYYWEVPLSNKTPLFFRFHMAEVKAKIDVDTRFWHVRLK